MCPSRAIQRNGRWNCAGTWDTGTFQHPALISFSNLQHCPAPELPKPVPGCSSSMCICAFQTVSFLKSKYLSCDRKYKPFIEQGGSLLLFFLDKSHWFWGRWLSFYKYIYEVNIFCWLNSTGGLMKNPSCMFLWKLEHLTQGQGWKKKTIGISS